MLLSREQTQWPFSSHITITLGLLFIIHYFIDYKLRNKKSGKVSIQDLDNKYIQNKDNFLTIGTKKFETPSYSGVYLENNTVVTPTPPPHPPAPNKVASFFCLL